VSEGLPLIYNGQEAGNTRRLAFFDKDSIEWRADAQGELYRRLIALKKANSALWNGAWGARVVRVVNRAPKQVLSFVRQDEGHKVFAVFNFSAAPQTVTFAHALHHGAYEEFFSHETAAFGAETRLEIEPWGYRVYLG
jgi:glycosidase